MASAPCCVLAEPPVRHPLVVSAWGYETCISLRRHPPRVALHLPVIANSAEVDQELELSRAGGVEQSRRLHRHRTTPAAAAGRDSSLSTR
jgi:hypothetical protein